LRSKQTLLLLGIAPLALLIFVACANDSNLLPPQPPAQQQPQPGLQAVSAAVEGYLGNDACKGCHLKEFNDHANSRHALSLRLVDRESLKEQSPSPGEIPNTVYQWQEKDGKFEFGTQGGRTNPLNLAFGSGKAGIAFLAVIGPEVMAEARMSYFPPWKKWYITPGQERLPEGSIGNLVRGETARQCVGCHSVTLPANSLMPEKRFMGVGCESCHGPGEAHVQAMSKPNPANIYMERFEKSGGKRINEMCGRCHRTEKDVETKNLSEQHTDLFQAHGLARSQCFKKSGDKLTCLTCHDPHQDVEEKEKPYEAACLRCHAGADNPQAAPILQSRACPVNAKEKCISCHMPKKPEPVFPGSPRKVADHNIRVHKMEDGKVLLK
jgi:hypothetical protein